MSKFKELQWFLDRIGKRIYRENNFCDCEICVDVWKKGLIVLDELHACIYLIVNQKLILFTLKKK